MMRWMDNEASEVIECHVSKQWCYHGCCWSLTDAQFKCLRGGGNYMMCLCDKCREPGRNEVTTRVESILDDVLKMLKGLKNRMDSTEAKHMGLHVHLIVPEGIVSVLDLDWG